MANQPALMTTTLWDFPSQQYGDESQGDQNYRGATPAYIIWNLLRRYTLPGELVVDPMAGSGTTLDVARELGRDVKGYDLQPSRPEITLCDARELPLPAEAVDFVFIDPPYSTHIRYSGDQRCIGELNANTAEYYHAMRSVIEQIFRVLKPGRYMALYVSDSYEKEKPFMPIGFELFGMMRQLFEPVDIIAVVRRNKMLLQPKWHMRACEEHFFLRGFNYLLIMRKPGPQRVINLTDSETEHQKPQERPKQQGRKYSGQLYGDKKKERSAQKKFK